MEMKSYMKVYVNFPSDDEGILELNKSIAMFHATLVMKQVDALNLDNASKRKVIKGLLEKAKEEINIEKNKGTSDIKH